MACSCILLSKGELSSTVAALLPCTLHALEAHLLTKDGMVDGIFGLDKATGHRIVHCGGKARVEVSKALHGEQHQDNNGAGAAEEGVDCRMQCEAPW